MAGGLASLAPVRTPARPGPGPLPEAALRALDLSVRRRITALLAGEFRSSQLGEATELAQLRPYVPGDDDVRRIDWNATARTGEPHVRVDVAERALTAWLVLDTSASMHFGSADRRKADVAEGVVLALGNVASRRGNRLGLVTFGGSSPAMVRPRQGRAGLVGTLLTLRQESEPGQDGATSLGAALERTFKYARQTAHLSILTDLRGPIDWAIPLARLAARHDVLVIEMRDPREDELPNVGELALVDPETGRQLRVDTRSKRLRERFAKAAADDRARQVAAVRRAGAEHLVLPTEGEWLKPLLAAMARRRRGR
jgi:uncharacterized protein (DUF58 family)